MTDHERPVRDPHDGTHDGPHGAGPRGPFVVRPERAQDRRPSRMLQAVLAVIAVAVLGLTGWGMLSTPIPSPAPAPSTSGPAENAPSEVAAASTSPSSGPPSAEPADIDSVLGQVAARAGWGDCPLWRGFGSGAGLTGEEVAREATRQGRTDGPLAVQGAAGPTVVWLGVDGEALVRRLGATVRVPDREGVWTVVPGADGAPVAVRYAPGTLPSGGVFWQERGRATPASYCLDDAGRPPATVVEVASERDPLARLFQKAGLAACRTWQRLETAVYPAPEEVDRAAAAMGYPVEASGWISLPLQPGYGEPQLRTWLGRDPAEAGGRHGSALLVLQAADPALTGDPTRAWIAIELDGRPAAVQLRVIETPAGRRAWLPTANAAGIVGSCGLEATARDTGGLAAPGVPVEAPGPTVEILRGGSDVLAMLAEHFGWRGCRISMTAATWDPPPGADVDRAAAAAELSAGWLDLGDRGSGPVIRVWVGDNLVSLARAGTVTVVAVGEGGTVWLADATRARAWRPVATGDGHTAWYETGASMSPDAPCAGTIGTPASFDHARSFTCWTDRARCLEAAGAAARAAPKAFGPGTEVAAGVGESCEPGMRCPWVGPNMPIVVTAAPAGSATSADVRVFTAGWRRLGQPFRELPRDEIGPGLLAMASRPSLALPVVPPGDPSAVYCPASGITGPLRGSPWDPRVAWIGSNAIRWPAGYTVRFTPGVELVTPFGDVYRAGDSLQVAGTASTDPVFVACQVSGGT